MSSAVDGFVPHDIASVANQLWFILSIFALSAIILVGNGVLFLTVALTGRLRVHKEYCILAATMLADFMYGLTFILSSLRWLKTYFFAAECKSLAKKNMPGLERTKGLSLKELLPSFCSANMWYGQKNAGAA